MKPPRRSRVRIAYGPSGRCGLLEAEDSGRLTEITIMGNRAEVRIVKEGLTNATTVTLVGDTAYVLIERFKAVAVPCSRPR